jgi:HEAT repeat protein
LVSIGTSQAVEALRAAFDRSKQIGERASLVTALGRIDRKRARDELATILADSGYLDIRLAATEGLGESGDLRYLQVLPPLLADPAPEMRLQAAAAILRLTGEVQLDPAG